MPRFCSEKSVFVPALALLAMSCTETRNLGSSAPHGRLPVDERNPIVLANDGADDNWQGEYAVLLANSGGPKLAGIIVNTSPPWPDLDANIAGWRGLVAAARASGFARTSPIRPRASGPPLVRPASGKIDDTAPNRSEGARLIVDTSARLSLPYRPLVVVTGGRLTDVADAYLIDPTVTERVVVVSSLGTTTASGGAMAAPNGEMDPWADAIVTRALSLRAGERVLRPAHGCPRLASVGAARQPVRRLDRREATEGLEPARGGRSGRRCRRSALPGFATEVVRVSATRARRCRRDGGARSRRLIRTAPPGSSPRTQAPRQPSASGKRCSVRPRPPAREGSSTCIPRRRCCSTGSWRRRAGPCRSSSGHP